MHYDVIIVGGGVVGLSLACALQDTALNIALLDATPAQEKQQKPDARLFALSTTSCQFLQKLQLWPHLQNLACAIKHIHVSYAKRFGALRFSHEEVNLSELGYVVPAAHLEPALWNQLHSNPRITLFKPAQVTALQDKVLQVKTPEHEFTLSAQLIIAADGTDSFLRQCLSIQTQTIDYQQTAIVTQSTWQRHHQHIAYERFLPESAIALLPLADHQCATIWSLPHTLAKKMLAASDQEFMHALQNAFGSRLGRLQQVTQRHSYPLRNVKAEAIVQDQVFLLGNAAHTLHPIAAQGLNLALYEVAIIAEHFYQRETCDLTLEYLHGIAKQLEAQQKFSTQTSHRIARLFKLPPLLTALAIPMGLVALDILAPVKNKLLNNFLSQPHAQRGLLLGT
jgi:2-octaprenyl-6-methoxyphenol hydroxylase